MNTAENSAKTDSFPKKEVFEMNLFDRWIIVITLVGLAVLAVWA